MSKQFDEAQEIEQRFRDASLRAHAARLTCAEPLRYDADGQRVCLDCEEPLSALRLKANPRASRCVDCQELFEWHERGAH